MNDAPRRIWVDSWGGYYIRGDIYRDLVLKELDIATQAADAHAAQLKAEAMAAKLAEALRYFGSCHDIYCAKERYHAAICDCGFDMVVEIIAEYEASKSKGGKDEEFQSW